MNWFLFFYAVAIGVTTGAIFRRHTPTQAEMRSMVATRILSALALAAIIPEHINGWMFAALALHELARGLEYGTALLADRWLAKREGRRWLRN